MQLRDNSCQHATDRPETSEIIHFRSLRTSPKEHLHSKILTFPFLMEEMCISKPQKKYIDTVDAPKKKQNVSNFPSLTTPDLLEHVARHCREPCTATPRTEVQNRGIFFVGQIPCITCWKLRDFSLKSFQLVSSFKFHFSLEF